MMQGTGQAFRGGWMAIAAGIAVLASLGGLAAVGGAVAQEAKTSPAAVETPPAPPSATPPAVKPAVSAKPPTQPTPAATATPNPVARIKVAIVPAEPPLQLPLDPVAAKAYGVLEKHCARCHQSGRLAEQVPAANFGNVLRLEELAADGILVRPGNPDGSPLYTSMVMRKMPLDADTAETDAGKPSVEEIEAVRNWIEKLEAKDEAASCQDRRRLDDRAVAQTIAAYLKTMPETAVSGLRFVTLATRYNSCDGKRELAVYAQAVIKLLNSLSSNAAPLRLETIDKDGLIIRFNLAELGWDGPRWDKLLAVYPYGVLPPDSDLQGALRATGTPLPYLRGDWLAAAASTGPLYAALMGQPESFKALQRQLNVDIDGDIRSYLAKRAGILESTVAEHDRVIERHPRSVGVLWTTYDFAGDSSRQSLTKYPLGPGGRNAFKHDASATIYALPNGFNGYYLSDAAGARIDSAPKKVLKDPAQRDQVVTSAISCIGCHRQGFHKAKDEIRQKTADRRGVARSVREAVKELYPPEGEFDKLVAADIERYRAAMVNAGLDPELTLNGVEIINALAQRYRMDLDDHAAAAELGASVETLDEQLTDADKGLVVLLRRLQQQTLSRADFEAVYTALLAKVSGAKPALLPGSGATAKMGGSPSSTKTTADGSDADLELTLYADKPVYERGELAQLTVTASAACNLTLINVDRLGKGTVIFPNDFHPKNAMAAGVPLTLPGPNAPYQFRLRDAGQETIIGICTKSSKNADGLEYDFEKQKFTNLGDYRLFLNKAIQSGATTRVSVDASEENRSRRRRRSRRKRASEEQAPAKPEVQARSAIKFEVR